MLRKSYLTGFWSSLMKMKLEVAKLDESPIGVCGYFANNGAKDLPPILHLDFHAFDLVSDLFLF